MAEDSRQEAARCPICGAFGDLNLKGWNLRDVKLCKSPPIDKCPNIIAAVKAATSKF
jgi:hypothetical protein